MVSNENVQGWTGTKEELMNTLAVFGCDRDQDGNFCVDGTIVSFMGAGRDYTVGGDAVYYKNGRPLPLASALRATSYGLHVVVL
jgi:hypothetical protein